MSLQIVTDTLQGIGGVAGLVALTWQIIEVVRRRRAAPFPSELRTLLMKAVEVMDDVVSEPRNGPWIMEHLRPIQQDIYRFIHIVPAIYQSRLSYILSKFMLISALGWHIGILGRDSTSTEQVGADAFEQRQEAKSAQECCREMLRTVPSDPT